jgi:hypothetical protein
MYKFISSKKNREITQKFWGGFCEHIPTVSLPSQPIPNPDNTDEDFYFREWNQNPEYIFIMVFCLDNKNKISCKSEGDQRKPHILGKSAKRKRLP